MNPIVDANTQQPIRTIFIADDDNDDVDLFKEAIKHIDPTIKVESLDNGGTLTTLLSNYLPDIIFLDLNMPLKNGLQCLQEIRKHKDMTHLPIVVYSSTTRPANISTAYEMGAHLFFVKPSIYAELAQSIDSILKLDWSDPNKIKDQYCKEGQYLVFKNDLTE